MDACRGGVGNPDRGRAHRSAIPPGPLALRFQLERSGRGDGPHLRVRNALPCGRVLAARRRKWPASGPSSTNRAKLAGGSLPCGYRANRRERGFVAVACRRASPDFGGLANVDTAFKNLDRDGVVAAITLVDEDPLGRRGDPRRRRPPNNLEAPGMPAKGRPALKVTTAAAAE